MTTTQRRKAAPQGRFARAGQWLGRAGAADSYERYTIALIGKSALAATIAWLISYDLLQAQSPAFAPFSAVLIMQVTVYQSLVHSLRFLVAVCVGVALQAALGFAFGAGVVTFVLLAVAALAIGQWRRLGSQGSQVATAAFFAFSTYVSLPDGPERLTQLGQIILLVLVGCGVGVMVNLLILPPLRYRGAEFGIQALAHSLCNLLSDIYPALREEKLEDDRTSHWRHRAAQLSSLSAQAQSSVQTAAESTYFNPRRLLRRHSAHISFPAYQALIDALERISHQVISMTRSLDQWEYSGSGEEHRRFLHYYGDFLAAIGETTQVFSKIDEDFLADHAAELCASAEQAREQHDRLVDCVKDSTLPSADPSHPYGLLLAEASRLMDEARHTCSVIRHSADSSLT